MKKVKLTKGKYALVDDQDFGEVSKLKWYPDFKKYTIYARTSKLAGRPAIRMHRFIMNPPKGKFVDHINGNGLDNRRENLRVCTSRENNLNRKRMNLNNTSGYAGVYKDCRRKGWQAAKTVMGKIVYLGHFQTREEASNAFEAYTKKVHENIS